MPRLHFCFVGSRPAMTVLAWIAVLPFDLRCAPPVPPSTTGRPGSSPPRSLPKQDFNAIPQQTASAEIPIASSNAHPRHTSRGFLPCRFADAGPRVRRATVVGPPSANLHKMRNTLDEDMFSGLIRRSQPVDATLYLRGKRWSVGWNGDFIEVLQRRRRLSYGIAGSAGSR